MSRQSLICGLITLFCVSASMAQIVSSDQCLPDLGNGNVCTANDITPAVGSISGPGGCTEGEYVSGIIADIRFVQTGGNSPDRYDIGLFIGNDGQSPIGGNSCTFDSLTPQTTTPGLDDLSNGSGPFRDIDGDQCGDIRASDVTIRSVALEPVLCIDRDGDGQLDVDAVLTWTANVNQDVCTSPTDHTQFFPQTSSKCRSEEGLNLPIDVENPPSISVEKIAVPSQLTEPGGDVTFRVVVSNNSDTSDPVNLFELNDDIHGSLNATCGLPVILAAEDEFTCDFVAPVTGNAGYTETDTVTATAEDDEGNSVSDSDQATVVIIADDSTIPGAIEINKSASPRMLKTAGGSVTYTLVLTNPSGTNVTINSLIDDQFGDVSASCFGAASLNLVAGDTYVCDFIEVLPAANAGDQHINTVTATGTDSNGDVISDSDSATVLYIAETDPTPPPSIKVIKTASPDEISAPSATVTFDVVIVNTSDTSDPVTLNTLIDDIHGDQTGACGLPVTDLESGESHECQFTATVTGDAGDVEIDTVTVTGQDDEGDSVTASDSAQVNIITDNEDIVGITKIAIPQTVEEPGESVRFELLISNGGQGIIDVTALSDDQYGNLLDSSNALISDNTCALPIEIDPAQSRFYRCQFTAMVSGNGGDTHVNTATVTAQAQYDNDLLSAEDDASVTITSRPPQITVNKSASPRLILAPGRDVTFSVQVDNVGGESVALDLLHDGLFDDITDSSNPKIQSTNCQAGVTIPVGASYRCSFVAMVTGAVSDFHTNTVTATASDNDGVSVTDEDRATVALLAILPTDISEIPTLGRYGLTLLMLGLMVVAVRHLRR